ncbi:tetratricopeptide repeat protein [Salibacter halophilus]|uniref:Tetratricopeptide repeat protein n=1 Tax=Salibacter halophilus TaxID=1803916 RepID=A0A6N6M9M0_9FLAO|nr:tetratricopeptide repeat protein [Salibacter halophilus]KAB1065573.1 tetratricopeptide repeat protein [Salibacter halophilus]
MKKYEKALIILFIIALGIQLIPYFKAKTMLTALLCGLIGISYLFGGYWLLNTKTKKIVIPILAGVAFCASIIVLPFTFRIYRDVAQKVLPIPNIILFLILGFYLIINNKDVWQGYKPIFVRSSIILLIVGIFSYTPPSFKPFRKLLSIINNGNKHLVNNMVMFNYMQKYDAAIENGNCDDAMYYAKMGNEAGMIWLEQFDDKIAFGKHNDINSEKEIIQQSNVGYIKSKKSKSSIVNEAPNKSQLKKIEGTFEGLYEAYKCKADKYFNERNYELALKYYDKANKNLNSCDFSGWNYAKAYSLSNLALCNKGLKRYDKADSLFHKALGIHKNPNTQSALILLNLGESLHEQADYNRSNEAIKKSNEIFKILSLQEERKNNIINNYHRLAHNYLYMDSLILAKKYIDKASKKVENNTTYYCSSILSKAYYEHTINNFSKGDSLVSVCEECFKKLLNTDHQNFAKIHYIKSLSKKKQGKYQEALESIKITKRISEKNFGQNLVDYSNQLAHINYEIGNYQKAKKLYFDNLSTIIKTYGKNNYRLPEILSDISQLQVSLTKFDVAYNYNAKSINSAKNIYGKLNKPTLSYLLNNSANVHYHLSDYKSSDSLYSKVLELNDNLGKSSILSRAKAMNGLGLTMTALEKYDKADSLFSESNKLYSNLFTKGHPNKATVLLNHASLKIDTRELIEAERMLSEALEISEAYLNPSHDLFGDIYFAFGKLYQSRKLKNKAINYYNKALENYSNKFDDHYKIDLVKEKLKSYS